MAKDMRFITTKSTVMAVLFAIMTILAFIMSITVITSQQQIVQKDRMLDSIPLRDDQRKQTIVKMESEMHQVGFLNDSTFVFVSGNDLFLQRLMDSVPLLKMRGHTERIKDYAVSPDGKRIVTSSSDGTLRLWDVSTGNCMAVSERVDTVDQPSWTMLHDIAYHRNGKKIVSADMEGRKTWRSSDLKMMSDEKSDIFYLSTGLLSSDGKTVCSRITDSISGFRIFRCSGNDYELKDYMNDMDPLCFSAEGKSLLVGNRDEGLLEIIKISRRSKFMERTFLIISDERVPFVDAVLSRDGNNLVTARTDGTIRISSARNGAERERLHWEGQSIDGVCVNHNGTLILAYSNGAKEYSIWGPFHWVI